jgi:hypothetical protein
VPTPGRTEKNSRADAGLANAQPDGLERISGGPPSTDRTCSMLQSTLYIDHSVVAHEASWKPIDDILSSGKVRLALSVWNLVEIGLATDKAQQARRLAFLEKHNPVWIVERIPLQKQEVQGFLWSDVFGVQPQETQVFMPYLSMVDYYHAGFETRLGLTASQWIAGVDFKKVEELKQLSPNALKILQAVDPKAFKKRQHEIFKPWIEPLVPFIAPDGGAMTKARRADLLDYCAEHEAQFFACCKSLAVEDSLTAARVTSPNRNPKPSDGIDLMHAVVAMAYCDFFLVRDGFVRTCSLQASKALAPVKMAALYDDPEKLRNDLA